MAEAPKTAPSFALDSLRALFEQYRHQSGKRARFPKILQEQAVSAVHDGHNFTTVASACGVSRASVSNWVGDSKPKARKINVVDSVKKSGQGEASAPFQRGEYGPTKLAFPNGLIAEMSFEAAFFFLQQNGGLAQ